MYARDESPWSKFESLKLEHDYNVLQKNIIKKLAEKKRTDLEEYKTRTRDYPRVILEQELEELTYQNTIFLRNSFELWQEAQKVTESIQPILFHYSWQQFNAFFIYTFFKWPMPSQGHGINCTLFKDIDRIEIGFPKTGFFKRLLDTFAILGHPSAYGQWIPLGSRSGLIFQDNKISSRIPTEVKLIQILNFDPIEFAKDFNSAYPNAYYGRHIDDHLTDYLLVFVASSIARYRPSLWRHVLDGRGMNEAKFCLRVKKAYAEYTSGVLSFLNTVWQIFLTWK